MEHGNLNIKETADSNSCAINDSLREQSLEWFFAKNEIEKEKLKDKYFPLFLSKDRGFTFPMLRKGKVYPISLTIKNHIQRQN